MLTEDCYQCGSVDQLLLYVITERNYFITIVLYFTRAKLKNIYKPSITNPGAEVGI